METDSCIAFWAALLGSTVWAASANPYSTVMAVVWGVFAVLIFAIDIAAARKEKKRSNAELTGLAPLLAQGPVERRVRRIVDTEKGRGDGAV